MNRVTDLILLLRPKQWVKNLFLYIPLFFAGKFFLIHKDLQLLAGFIAFSLVAGSIYILNDYRDIEADKLHPSKSKRPLASGRVSAPLAFVVMTCSALLGFLIAWYVRDKFLFILV